MTIKKIQNDKQRIITTSMIVSTEFCENICPLFMKNKEIIYKTFDKFSTTVINWCLEYYNKYNKAPHSQIQDIFNDKKQYLQDEERNLIKQLLKSLSDNYERSENFNEQYNIDQAKLYIREVNLEILKNNIDELKKAGKIEEAEHLIFTYENIEKDTERRETTDILDDIDTAKYICDNIANENSKDQLYKLRGDIGKDLGWIYRSDFVMFAGFGKMGKSFIARENAVIAAIEHGLNVFIFNLEMAHTQYVRNFYQNISNEIKYNEEKTIRIPYFEKINDKWVIKYKQYTKKGLNSNLIENKLKKVNMKSKGKIIVESFPSNTLTHQKCIQVLDEYFLKGIVCDVLVIDFLDNLKTFYKGDFRHGIADKWTNARKLAQQKHIAVITVSHTNTSTLKGNVEPGKLSEENRKYNDVTAGIGINQLPHEKEAQYSRLNIIANRDGNFNFSKFYISLECKDIGSVMLDTKDARDIILDDLEDEE